MAPSPPPSVPALLLVRHGQTTWNLDKRWQGRAESALTPAGRAQADQAGRALAGRLGADPVVWTSPLQRARDTAHTLAAHLGATVARTDARLVEADVGAWEGLTLAEVERQWPGYLAAHRRPEGFEPDPQVIDRITGFCREVLTAVDTPPVHLAVCHSGVMRTLRRWAGVEDRRIPNLGAYWVWMDLRAGLRLGDLLELVPAQ